MAECKLYLFGAPRLEGNGQPILIALRKALAILIYLAVTRQPYSRDALATLFWPEKDQQGARGNLRRTLYDLSQLLGQPLSDQLLEVGPETVSLRTDAPLWMDIVVFQQSLATYLSPNLTMQAVDSETLLALTATVDLYTADFLAGFTLPDCPAFAEWQFFRGEELRRGCVRLLEQLLLIFETQRKFDDAVRYARRWLQLEPLEETVHRQLMRLYAQAGQQAAALRQYDECVRMLTEELNATPEKETTALYEAIRTKRFPAPDKKTRRQDDKMTQPTNPDHLVILSSCHPVISTPPHNLPTQNTPFVGRAQELAEILQRLADPDCRLLTLIGPGGIGKTRLALEAAQRILDLRFWILDSVSAQSEQSDNPKSKIANLKFPEGLFFVPLQPLGSANELALAIASAIGFQFYGSTSPQQQLLHFLRDKQLLLVLDNFEHVLPGVDLVAAILAGAPGVKLLVTTREALKLQEEWFHPVAGMRLPPQARLPTTAHLPIAGQQPEPTSTYDAVQLFIQAAQRAVVTFQPIVHQAEIVRICRLVDGLPLALELAAAWLKVLTCAQIADEIEHGIDILIARHQNVPERQRSMRAIFDKTWAQLTSKEQRVLAALSIFRGSWNEAAAATVGGATPFRLAALIDHGLLQVTTTASPVTYTLHELVRQYAASRLQEDPGVAAQVAEQHCRYYANFLRELEAAFRTADSAWAYQEMQREWANIVVAWEAAVTQGSVATLDAFVHSLGHFHQFNNWFADGCQLLQPAIARLEAEATGEPEGLAVLAKLLGWQGDFYLAQDQEAQGEACLLRALTLAQETDQPASTARALGKLADMAHAQKDRPRAQALAQEALAIYQQIGDEMGVGWIFIRLGKFALDANEYTQARDHFMAALQLCRKHRYHANTSIILGYLGRLALQTGAAAEAGRYFHEALQAQDRAAGHYFREELLEGLGAVAEAQGDYPIAQHYYEESLALCRKSGAPSDVAYALTQLGELSRKTGDYAVARRYLQEAFHLHEQVGEKRGMAGTFHRLGLLAQSEENYTAAEQHYNASLQLFMTLSGRFGQALALHGLGQVAHALEDHNRAYIHYTAALRLALALNAQSLTLDVLVSLAEHWLADGRNAAACLLASWVERQATMTYETRTQAQAFLAQQKALFPKLLAQAQAQITEKFDLITLLQALGLDFRDS